MKELKISVSKILGTCTADPPMHKGENLFVSNGDIHIPDGGSFCIWALQSLLPLIPAKERKICESKKEDWMWRVHHVQCPDPDGRVIFRIERKPKRGRGHKGPKKKEGNTCSISASTPSSIRDLKISVREINGHCTSKWKPGDFFLLKSGRLFIPSGCSICLYALQAALPFLAAKQRLLQEGDWLNSTDRFLCPDPAGNVILQMEQV